jgi:nitrate reductase NapE component
MVRPCVNCGELGGDPRICRRCDEIAPHGAVRSAEPESDARLLIGLFWLLAVAVVTFLGLWVLVFTIGALGP